MLTINSTIKELTAVEEIAKIIEEYIPDFRSYKEFKLIRNFKIKFIIGKGHLVGLTQEQEREMINRIENYLNEHKDGNY